MNIVLPYIQKDYLMTLDPKIAIRQARYREKKKALGLIRFQAYLTPDEIKRVLNYIEEIRKC